MKKGIIIIAAILMSFSTFANGEKGGEWLVNALTFEQMLEASKKEKRVVLVDVYTDWCGWCKKMDATTFNNPKIAEYLNKHFYFVKFNAEQRGDIEFNGKTYVWKPSGRNGTHEIARYVTNNQLTGYPTIAFLDESLKSIQSISSYLTPQDIEPILHWFVEKPYQQGKTWEEYRKDFKSNL